MKSLSRLAAAAAFAIAASAQAALTIDPASFPPVVEEGVEFGPVRVIATDANGNRVPHAFLRWVRFAAEIVAVDPEQRFCKIDGAGLCSGNADAQGVFTLPRMYSRLPGERQLELVGDTGNATIRVTVVPYSRPDTLTLVSGGDQRVVARGSLPQPIVVRAANFQGQPIAGQVVTFRYADLEAGSRFASASPSGIYEASVVTDAQGLAVSPPVTTTEGLGAGAVNFEMAMPGTQLTVRGSAPFTATTPDGRTSLALQDMWWSGFRENGWGLSIAQHDDRLFAVAFVYDAAGLPTWHVLPAGQWTGGQRFSEFTGTWYSPRGTPYFAYDASRLVVGTGSIQSWLTFDGESAGEMNLAWPVQPPVKRIVHQDFTYDTPSPITGLGDMWWGGPSQNGWGISIMEQRGGLFSVWFTYDAQGAPIWLVMPEGRWTSNDTYEGPIYRTQSSSWPDYDARRLQVFTVGTYRYRFASTTDATFDYTIGPNSGSLAITRQSF